MDDRTILDHIDQLAAEEQALHERSHAGEALGEEEHEQLRKLEVTLDQCWDLLRQRRARRNAGLEPDDASVRGEGTVEGYRQ